ncbi:MULTISPECIES: REP-associated tyrosine transposase [unclassified Moraxella]|uniref:REP-associated tyrosine transposase n=1 Tax=unclassified Moraxella TaxID=2685852 RepID=UPI003AF9DA48
MQYRRFYQHGATYFFTINLADRRSDLLVQNIDLLRTAFKTVKDNHPFHIDAIVVLPDHIHTLWTLPADNADYSIRIRLIKYYFSHALEIQEHEVISKSRQRKQERGIWQRRFWEHCIRNEQDYLAHINYIHLNPVKHGLVTQVKDWEFSSFHLFVARGDLPIDWFG